MNRTTMLPLYRRTMRFLSDPYLRMKKRAIIAVVGALVVLYVVMVGFASHEDAIIQARPGFEAPKHTTATLGGDLQHPKTNDEGDDRPVLRGDGKVDPMDKPLPMEPPKPGATRRPVVQDGGGAGALDAEIRSSESKKPTEPPASQLPYFVRLVLPLLAGFCFGFLGSVPIAGPTSAMVLKLGIQGKYQSALTIAFGGAISEATYAGIAFWGFGSFLAGAKFLLPVSKVLGAIMFTVVGLIFLKSDFKSPLDVDPGAASHKGMRAAPRDEILKNVLMGLTMSGINPALLATYTGAIASVYGTGMLEFNLFLAIVFGIGVCCGVSTWFFILLSLLQKYKQRLKKQTIGYIMRGMGCFLLTLAALCAKSSFEYFFLSGGSESTQATTP